MLGSLRRKALAATTVKVGASAAQTDGAIATARPKMTTKPKFRKRVELGIFRIVL